jgi:hypothetical protein
MAIDSDNLAIGEFCLTVFMIFFSIFYKHPRIGMKKINLRIKMKNVKKQARNMKKVKLERPR